MEFRPATLSDFARLCPAVPRRIWKGAAVQITAAPSWTLWHDGAPLLIGSLVPFHSGIFEACLMVPPGAKLSLAALRYTMMRVATVMPDSTIIARIDDDNSAGQRLARLIGFVPIDEHLAGTAIRTWVRINVTDFAPA